MNIETTKIDLVQQLLNVDDEKVLLKIRKILEEDSGDWYNKLSVEEKKEIEIGVQQADEGKVVSHESVMSKFKQWH